MRKFDTQTSPMNHEQTFPQKNLTNTCNIQYIWATWCTLFVTYCAPKWHQNCVSMDIGHTVNDEYCTSWKNKCTNALIQIKLRHLKFLHPWSKTGLDHVSNSREYHLAAAYTNSSIKTSFANSDRKRHTNNYILSISEQYASVMQNAPSRMSYFRSTQLSYASNVQGYRYVEQTLM